MKSLYLKVLVWSIVTVAVAMTGLFVHARFAMQRGGGAPFQSARILADVASRIYVDKGADALQSFLLQVRETTGGDIYVTDPNGRDLISGDDRSHLLQEQFSGTPRFLPPLSPPPRVVLAGASSDKSIRWITVLDAGANARSSPSEAFIWILAAVSLLAYLFTFYLVSPLRKLGSVVERFGAGDLTARALSGRRDELGNLARAFDQMAERIDTLVTSERRLLQDISHELRTPLARMRFAVEVARTDPNKLKALGRIRKECDRLSLLTEELLEISVVEGDSGSRQLETVDLSELLTEITADATLEASNRNLRLTLRTPPSAQGKIDRELLRRAIDNVLRNAIRYSPDGETIDVTVVADAVSMNIAVRNRGPGVPAEMSELIFQPFFRAESHRPRNGDARGVGLGLAIARRAAQWHHGSIKAENAGPGLRVTLTLPVPLP